MARSRVYRHDSRPTGLERRDAADPPTRWGRGDHCGTARRSNAQPRRPLRTTNLDANQTGYRRTARPGLTRATVNHRDLTTARSGDRVVAFAKIASGDLDIASFGELAAAQLALDDHLEPGAL